MVDREFRPSVQELRALERKLERSRGKTAAAILDYIAGRRTDVKDAEARRELREIAQRLYDHRNLDYALNDVREALAAVFVAASGINASRHQHDCPAVQPPAMSPGECICRSALVAY
jgi:hypothetical protein